MIEHIQQPEIIDISDSLRLRKYDGNYEIMLTGYQDPYIYQNSEGIFDETQKPDLDYVKGMCEYLDRAGELYFIEVKEGNSFISIGDVTVKAENPPIAIWTDNLPSQKMHRKLGFQCVDENEREYIYDLDIIL